MSPILTKALAVAVLAVSLTGCQRHESKTVVLPTSEFGATEADNELDASATPAPVASGPAAAAPSDPATRTFSALTAFAPSTDRDPVVVLANWAKAVELKDWRTVRAYWGDGGARSGLGNEAFEKRWGRLHEPRVTLGKGQQEGAAGSLFYTASVRIDDGGRAVQGEVTLRRVNDVSGASPEQLRWHIERSTLPL
ncbi:hypothetical protein [Novosphingobium sp. FKTRR1]|uniref:hypothetical protein n=1 Tax=Novosphingobium sp. FKTRR1 TaxID=2879118 RepID=UPI001CEFB510|nr:hypothetical protein [Novosphingobium sp. FKTRR1]